MLEKKKNSSERAFSHFRKWLIGILVTVVVAVLGAVALHSLYLAGYNEGRLSTKSSECLMEASEDTILYSDGNLSYRIKGYSSNFDPDITVGLVLYYMASNEPPTAFLAEGTLVLADPQTSGDSIEVTFMPRNIGSVGLYNMAPTAYVKRTALEISDESTCQE